MATYADGLSPDIVAGRADLSLGEPPGRGLVPAARQASHKGRFGVVEKECQTDVLLCKLFACIPHREVTTHTGYRVHISFVKRMREDLEKMFPIYTGIGAGFSLLVLFPLEQRM
jgi:hypothetical protein